MNQYYQQQLVLFSQLESTLLKDNGSYDARRCNQFWDPVDAHICPRYVPYITIIPLAISLTIILLRALGLLISYRPKWPQAFVKEIFVDRRTGLKSVPRRRLNFSICSLLVFSLCGTIFQAIGSWIPVFQVQAIYGVVTWAVVFLLVAILWPRSTPVSLLVIFVSIALWQAIILTGMRTASHNDRTIAILQIIIALSAGIVILNMPLRDPDIPSDDISPAFTPPTVELRSPEDNLTLWQFLSVSWMSPLIFVGKGRQLNDEDVWTLGYEFQHRRLHDTFRELRGSVIRRLIRANVIDLVLLSGLGIVELVSNLSGPLLLQQLLKSMENPAAPRSAAITYAVLSLVVQLISGQTGVLGLWFGRRCYERSRGEMITMLYEKTLNRKIVGAHQNSTLNGSPSKHADDNEVQPNAMKRLYHFLMAPSRMRQSPTDGVMNAKYKESASMGKILNLMRNDVYEVAQRFWEFQSLVTKPLGLVLSVILLWQLIGWSCMVGVIVVVMGQGFNALFARALLYYERRRRTATDKKLQKVSQFVESIRHLRWYGWQDTWCGQVMEAREHELNLRIVTGLWNILISFTNALATVMFPVAAFWAYTTLAGLPLRIDIAFPALQAFSILEVNLREIPGLITVLLNARVAVGRIEDFMKEPDKDRSGQDTQATNGTHNFTTSHDLGKNQGASEQNPCIYDQLVGVGLLEDGESETDSLTEWIEIKHATFAWPGSFDSVLRDITLSFPPGLNVICGQVGAGKTALLQAILGELDHTGGQFFRSDEVIGYCAQTPWLQSMNIRENILFSAPYEEGRYRNVLEACALNTDMASFKHGDFSNIGENGIGLSGGQRARVALARAVYSSAKILLLDDPISALDHQTAEYIVNRCLTGKMVEGRTVILVTHRTELCHGLAQQIVEVTDGTIHILDPKELPHTTDTLDTVQEDAEMTVEDKSSSAVPEKFIEDEHRAHGGVKRAVYWEYIKAGKLRWWFLLLVFLALARLVNVWQTWFLKQWGEAYDDNDLKSRGLFDNLPSPETNIKPWLVGFLLIAVAKAVIFLIFNCIMLIIVYSTGRQMFRDVMIRVSHAKFRFYDVTPVGRLMNRLTSDINTIDGNISGQFEKAALMLSTWVISLVVIASVTPIFLVFSLALTVAFVVIFLRYLPTSQSLRRLEMVSLSPLMSNFGALLDGLTTVRAFCAQHRFQDRVIMVTDAFQKNDHFYWSLQAWLMYRFDVLSACSTLLLTLIAIYTGISSGLTAFVLTAAAQFVMSTRVLCRTYGQLEMDFVSVERVVELLHVEQEKPGTIDPPAWWPTLNGDIVFENVTIRYAPHLDPSLTALSFRIHAGSSTAIIGRTGSGKSTLAMALLATVLPESGQIFVDNIDIAAVDTQALRERITFVAQDPVLFPGSMRQNLDPLNEYSDEECEYVLVKICGRHQWTLDTHIEAAGRNLSQGQRQLIGLARTLLRRSPIVILDEATASIDMETAKSIQTVLHEEMQGRTVITIAHRLEAVKNAEYCIVLDKGRVIKQGRAEDILREEGNKFLEEFDLTA